MVTKRQLGYFLIGCSVLGVLALFAVDLLGAGQFGGFGPLQRLGMALAAPVLLVGVVLTRLGNRPA